MLSSGGNGRPRTGSGRTDRTGSGQGRNEANNRVLEPVLASGRNGRPRTGSSSTARTGSKLTLNILKPVLYENLIH